MGQINNPEAMKLLSEIIAALENMDENSLRRVSGYIDELPPSICNVKISEKKLKISQEEN